MSDNQQYTIDEDAKPRNQRENLRQALISMGAPNTYGAQDPEHLESMKKNKKDLEEIYAKNTAIKERYARMQGIQQSNSLTMDVSQSVNKNTELDKIKSMESVVKQPETKVVETIKPKEEKVNKIERDDILVSKTDIKLIREKVPVKENDKIIDNRVVDKKVSLETKEAKQDLSEKMIEVAAQRGWKNIKVSGSDQFKKQVWEKAAEKGMDVKGYEPNSAEKEKVANKLMAKAFNSNPEKALKAHPELESSFIALKAIEKKAKQDGLDKKQLEYVNNRVRTNISNSISQGKFPQVKQEQQQELSR